MVKIWLDAGHGGVDPGACGHNLKEKDLTLRIARACKNELYLYEGVSIKMTRATDKFVHLNTVCNNINKWDADIAVSIHINAGGGNGREAIVAHSSPEATRLADHILDYVKEVVPKNRGIKTRLNSDGSDYFGFNRIPNCPSPIIEYFFIDSSDYKYAEKCVMLGKLTARGIAKHLGLKKKTRYVKYKTLYRMNVRKSPAAVGGKAGRVAKGTKFNISSIDKNGWGKIYSGDYKNCYVRIKSDKKTYCEKV